MNALGSVHPTAGGACSSASSKLPGGTGGCCWPEDHTLGNQGFGQGFIFPACAYVSEFTELHISDACTFLPVGYTSMRKITHTHTQMILDATRAGS